MPLAKKGRAAPQALTVSSCTVQEAVAAAMEEAASAAGASSALHAFWGATSYHPEDLPSAGQFRTAAGAKPLQAQASSGNGEEVQKGPLAREVRISGVRAAIVDPGRVAAVPGVMTNFIKVRSTQCLTPVVSQGCGAFDHGTPLSNGDSLPLLGKQKGQPAALAI